MSRRTRLLPGVTGVGGVRSSLSSPPPKTTVYLTGVSTAETRAAHRPDLGLLSTPDSGVQGQSHHYPFHAADNGIFAATKPRKDGSVKGWDEAKWRAWLLKLDTDGLLFVTLPDVLHWFEDPDYPVGHPKHWFPVGDCDATIKRGAEYIDELVELELPVALVAQDGLRSLDQVPYADKLDALFIGGSDAYKLGDDVRQLVAEAKARGLWVHVGRVNSLKRMRISQALDADSADGTILAFGPKANYPRVIGWLDTLAADARA